MKLNVTVPLTVPDVAVGVYHLSVDDEPDNGFVTDHVVPASTQNDVAVVVSV